LIGRNIKAVVAYDGTDFHGWQVQPALRTIQGTLQEKLSGLLNEDIRLTAAGRTDRGVHADGQVVNFTTSRTLPLQNLRLALNQRLPRDIFIREVREVSSGFNARFSAVCRTYYYRLGMWDMLESPLTNRFTWYPGVSLDMLSIEKASSLFLGKRDFRAFAKESELGDNTICEVQQIAWERSPCGYSFQVTANRFLPHMIRRILALLIDIGSMKYDISLLEEILSRGADAWPHPWLAPPQGLCLHHVRY
jgi:tRNA pseudouridine38-40 synthase